MNATQLSKKQQERENRSLTNIYLVIQWKSEVHID